LAQKKGLILDLHGYPLDAVDDAVDRFLRQAVERGAERARIMTGKGTGAVQKATIAYLRQAGYPWEFERMEGGRRNEGVIVVFMD
jgi:DNA-nicking Smr family endonuclease